MKTLRIRFILIPIAITISLLIGTPVYAIDLPDSTPNVESIYCYRNVLETGDFFAIFYENTPYASEPDIGYSEAFIWRFMDTDGETELAQSLGYNYHDSGYGYNVICFYFDAEEAPDWEQIYFLTLSGTPSAFESPPTYTYSIESGDYSSLTVSDEVKTEIAAQVLRLATDLDNKWGLSASNSLLLETETGTVLSIYGEAFFRGAIYGIQAIAPASFRLIINTVITDERTWTTTYVTELEAQNAESYIGPAIEAGERLLDVDYNLMGIIGIFLMCALIVGTHWWLSGGNLWKGAIECCSPLVIATRMGVFGLGELGTIAAISWLYASAKLWKII